jgi:hypothetical protein
MPTFMLSLNWNDQGIRAFKEAPNAHRPAENSPLPSSAGTPAKLKDARAAPSWCILREQEWGQSHCDGAIETGRFVSCLRPAPTTSTIFLRTP